MRVVAWPIGDMSVASSRLRLFEPLRRMDDVDVQILTPTANGARERMARDRRQLSTLIKSADLVYVQKDARPAAIALARAARDAHVPIVYDLDDDVGCWPDMAETELVASAQHVVVDSLERALTLSGVATTSIPCMIDLADDPARNRKQAVNSGLVVGSFGNRSSLLGTLPWLRPATQARRVRVIGPTDPAIAGAAIAVTPFDLGTFVSEVMAMNAVILAHDADESTRKDENRLVMALSCARPTLVGPTPSYAALVAEFDAAHLVLSSPTDVPHALEELNDPRFARVKSGYEYVWTRYHPTRISGELRQVFEAAVGGAGE